MTAHGIAWPADVGPSTEWRSYTRGNVGEITVVNPTRYTTLNYLSNWAFGGWLALTAVMALVVRAVCTVPDDEPIRQQAL